MDAIAYAQWCSDNDKKNNYRLPTNAEWENAAIDYNKNLYPWGNEDKILTSTMTDSETDRYEYPVDSITEDCSYLGMRNLMGGDEFTMIFIRQEETAVRDILDRLKTLIREAGYSVSIGYAMRSGREETVTEMLRRSDEWMYADKARYYRENTNDRRRQD